MNRSCYNGKVTLKDASGKTLQTGWLRDYIYSSSDDSNDDEDMLKNDDPANNGYHGYSRNTYEGCFWGFFACW